LVENLRYIGESYGWEYVSLGTDFLGIEKTPEGFDNVMKVNDLLKYVEGHEEEVLWKNAMRVIMANMV
ncbi:MAG: membrane dipeptidase, partial [Metallosphaera sp.]